MCQKCDQKSGVAVQEGAQQKRHPIRDFFRNLGDKFEDAIARHVDRKTNNRIKSHPHTRHLYEKGVLVEKPYSIISRKQ